jgi:YD repeat-containing protein
LIETISFILLGGTVAFKYDPLGRRIYKNSSAGTSVFAYDGDNLIEETKSSAGGAAFAVEFSGGRPLVVLRGVGGFDFFSAA